jgi:hypothetical protein
MVWPQVQCHTSNERRAATLFDRMQCAASCTVRRTVVRQATGSPFPQGTPRTHLMRVHEPEGLQQLPRQDLENRARQALRVLPNL